jgi:hypothetical protein
MWPEISNGDSEALQLEEIHHHQLSEIFLNSVPAAG